MNKKVIDGFTFEKGCKYRVEHYGSVRTWLVKGIRKDGIFVKDDDSARYDVFENNKWLEQYIKRGMIEIVKESKVKKLLDAIDKV